MFQSGQQIELVYPVNTDIVFIENAARRVRNLYVHRIRDLVTEPLTPSEYLRRPYVARSRWLILASERQGERPKQFYLGSADNFRAPGSLRLALYEPGAPRPIRLISRQIDPTPYDRRFLMRLIHRVADVHRGYELRVLADDLAIVR